MAEVKTYSCDECKTQKKDANHWWLISESNNRESITIYQWKNPTNNRKHFCSHECVVRHIQKWMGTKTAVSRVSVHED